ncbi:hypothetical protein ACFJIX_29030 [Roseateles sp. UC29_93]|uniref:hypothetical protein n=1 Tax=Roseateles sp. UC29_93 TaxID=3350177 RepID=UPI00367118EA
MSTKALSRSALAPILASLLALPLACAGGPNAAAEEDRKAAAALNREGDRAYQEGRFDKALKAYMNSYPNHATSHAYLMAGDAYWRAVLAANQTLASSKGKDACPLTNAYFAQDAGRSLDQYYRPGLALIDKETADAQGLNQLRERSRTAASCLAAVQAKYAALPKTACVDLRDVASCVGEPLKP